MDRVVFESVPKVFRHRPALFNWLGKERGGGDRGLETDLILRGHRRSPGPAPARTAAGKTQRSNWSRHAAPDAGSVFVAGFNTLRDGGTCSGNRSVSGRYRAIVFPTLSARENLEFFAALDDVPAANAPNESKMFCAILVLAGHRHARDEVFQRACTSASGSRAPWLSVPARTAARRATAASTRHHRSLLEHYPRPGTATKPPFCSPPTISPKRRHRRPHSVVASRGAARRPPHPRDESMEELRAFYFV